MEPDAFSSARSEEGGAKVSQGTRRTKTFIYDIGVICGFRRFFDSDLRLTHDLIPLNDGLLRAFRRSSCLMAVSKRNACRLRKTAYHGFARGSTHGPVAA